MLRAPGELRPSGSASGSTNRRNCQKGKTPFSFSLSPSPQVEQHLRGLVGLLEGGGEHAVLGKRDGADVGRADQAVHHLPLHRPQPGRACLRLLCQRNAESGT